MPLFSRKSIFENDSLSDLNLKLLKRSRSILAKELDIAFVIDCMNIDDVSKQEFLCLVSSSPVREHQVCLFLDILETKGDRLFTAFMDVLSDNYSKSYEVVMEMSAVLHQENLHITEDENAVLTGDAVKRILEQLQRPLSLSDISDVFECDGSFESRKPTKASPIACYTVSSRGKFTNAKHYQSVSSEYLAQPKDMQQLVCLNTDLSVRLITRGKLMKMMENGYGNLSMCADSQPFYIFVDTVANTTFLDPEKTMPPVSTSAMKFFQKLNAEKPSTKKVFPPPVPPKPKNFSLVMGQKTNKTSGGTFPITITVTGPEDVCGEMVTSTDTVDSEESSVFNGEDQNRPSRAKLSFSSVNEGSNGSISDESELKRPENVSEILAGSSTTDANSTKNTLQNERRCSREKITKGNSLEFLYSKPETSFGSKVQEPIVENRVAGCMSESFTNSQSAMEITEDVDDADDSYESIDLFNGCTDPTAQCGSKEAANIRHLGKGLMLLLVSSGLSYKLYSNFVSEASFGLNNNTQTVNGKENLTSSANRLVLASLLFDKEGNALLIPNEYLSNLRDPSHQPWFYPIEILPSQASMFLESEHQEGCFLVYRPSVKLENVAYVLSVFSFYHFATIHYYIVENLLGDLSVRNHDHTFLDLMDLVDYYRKNKSVLVTRLRRPLKYAKLPLSPSIHYPAQIEIQRSNLFLYEEPLNLTGSDVLFYPGKYSGNSVTIKVLQKIDISCSEEDDFAEEAKILSEINHSNVTKLVGVCFRTRPLFIVTESFVGTVLKDALIRQSISFDVAGCLSVCLQVVSAMAHLESCKYVIHRNVSSSSFLLTIGEKGIVVKLFDLSRAKRVIDDSYIGDEEEIVNIKYASPEVLFDLSYSTKSDVWAVGVLLWEVFSSGNSPYGNMPLALLVQHLTDGKRLGKPPLCPRDLYDQIFRCWKENPRDRPSFLRLKGKLDVLSEVYMLPTLQASSSFARRRRSRSAHGGSGSVSFTASVAEFPSNYEAGKSGELYKLLPAVRALSQSPLAPAMKPVVEEPVAAAVISFPKENVFVDFLKRNNRIRMSFQKLMRRGKAIIN